MQEHDYQDAQGFLLSGALPVNDALLSRPSFLFCTEQEGATRE